MFHRLLLLLALGPLTSAVLFGATDTTIGWNKDCLSSCQQLVVQRSRLYKSIRAHLSVGARWHSPRNTCTQRRFHTRGQERSARAAVAERALTTMKSWRFLESLQQHTLKISDTESQNTRACPAPPPRLHSETHSGHPTCSPCADASCTNCPIPFAQSHLAQPHSITHMSANGQERAKRRTRST